MAEVDQPPRNGADAPGELRQDIITGKWVAVATGRAKRPDEFAGKAANTSLNKRYVDDCPFCNLVTYPQEPDVLRLPDSDAWQVHVFGNKYPAFAPRSEVRTWQEGPYRAMESVGYHEILATREHNQHDHLMSVQELALVFEALVLRYRELKVQQSVNYIQIIKNFGAAAGGSLEHPHHQLFTVPVLPHDVHDVLYGAEAYAREHEESPFTAMLRFELEQGERVVWQNDDFVVVCPYASRVPFETWVLPRQPEPFFENSSPALRESLAEAMQAILGRLHAALPQVSYNYFIHSAPCDDTGFVCDASLFQHFRWHIEIMPRMTTFGGFELGTGLEITTVLPEEGAVFLREALD